MIELKEGISVVAPNGEEVGKINRFGLDPATHEVTHIVVQKGWLLPEDKVVPFEMVSSATEDKVVLNEGIDDFNKLPPFEERHFISASDKDTSPSEYSGAFPGYYWYPPHGFMGYPGYGLGYPVWPPTETRRNIPEDTIALKEGTDVMSSDGEHVGGVERLFVEPDSNEVTHFLISQGLLFKEHKLVPSHWVRSVEEDKVHLTVSSKVLERLPSHQS